MDIEQIKKACESYKRSINLKGYLSPTQHPIDEYCSYDLRYPHLLWMCEEILSGRVSGEQAYMYFGFIQGVLWEDCQRKLDQLQQDIAPNT